MISEELWDSYGAPSIHAFRLYTTQTKADSPFLKFNILENSDSANKVRGPRRGDKAHGSLGRQDWNQGIVSAFVPSFPIENHLYHTYNPLPHPPFGISLPLAVKSLNLTM
jgi:hypothetical protein